MHKITFAEFSQKLREINALSSIFRVRVYFSISHAVK